MPSIAFFLPGSNLITNPPIPQVSAHSSSDGSVGVGSCWNPLLGNGRSHVDKVSVQWCINAASVVSILVVLCLSAWLSLAVKDVNVSNLSVGICEGIVGKVRWASEACGVEQESVVLDRPAHTAMFSKSFERQANGCRREEFQKSLYTVRNEGEDHNVHNF